MFCAVGSICNSLAGYHAKTQKRQPAILGYPLVLRRPFVILFSSPFNQGNLSIVNFPQPGAGADVHRRLPHSVQIHMDFGGRVGHELANCQRVAIVAQEAEDSPRAWKFAPLSVRSSETATLYALAASPSRVPTRRIRYTAQSL